MNSFFLQKQQQIRETPRQLTAVLHQALYKHQRHSLQGRELTKEHSAPEGCGHTHSEWPNSCQALQSTYSHRYKCFWLQFYWTNFKPLKHLAFKSTKLLGSQQPKLPNSFADVAISGVTGDRMALAWGAGTCTDGRGWGTFLQWRMCYFYQSP